MDVAVVLRDVFVQIDVDMSGTIEWSEFTDYCIANATASSKKEDELLVPDLNVRKSKI